MKKDHIPSDIAVTTAQLTHVAEKVFPLMIENAVKKALDPYIEKLQLKPRLKIWSINKTAKYFGCSNGHIKTLIKKRLLKTLPSGRIPEEEVYKFRDMNNEKTHRT